MERLRIMRRHMAFRKSLIAGALIALACGVSGNLAGALLPPPAQRPIYVPNQVLVTLRGGVSEQVAQNVAAGVGGQIVRKPMYSHTYVVQLPESSTAVDKVLSRRSTLIRQYPGLENINRNAYWYLAATPNDELYPSSLDPLYPTYLMGQWQLQPTLSAGHAVNHIYAPEGWDIQKGSKDIVVAVIDTGVRDRPVYNSRGRLVRRVHPDLSERMLYGEDLADLGADDRANPGPAPSEGGWTEISYEWMGVSHGTHVAGIIAAQANNWIGVAGMCWDYVWVLPLKVAKDSDLSISDAAIIDAIYYAIQWRGAQQSGSVNESLKVNVINMSLGTYANDGAIEQVISLASKNGIIVVASAGNDWTYGPYPPGYPAAYDDVICVGATGYDDEISIFSNRGRAMDISAPGWTILSTYWSNFYATVDDIPDDQPVPPDVILPPRNGNVYPMPPQMPTWPDIYGNTFAFMTGTSMASPCVAGAVALLLSNSVPPSDIREILYSTATPKGLGRPNDTFGWGLLNIGAALHKASIDVKISSPGKGAVVQTSRPRFRVDLRHARLDSIRVSIDGADVMGGDPDWLQKYYYILDADAGKSYLLFEYAVDPSKAVNGAHNIVVSAESDMDFESPPPVPLTSTDNVQFRVEPRTMSAGWRLFSIPASFDQPQKPEEVLGNVGVLARWNYATNPFGDYALYSLDRTRTDEEGTFTPLGAYSNNLVHPVGQSDTATPPAGLGYWLYLPLSSSIEFPEGAGQAISDTPYVIGLYYGWNMVGNPFPFPVDWSNVVVEYAGMRATAEEAVQNGWLSDSIYRYDNVYTRYVFKTVASAVMIPWEAQWVKVKARTPELSPSVPAAWSDEFNDGVLDVTAPEPAWSTNGSVTETGGMLRLTGTAGQPSYCYLVNTDYPIYGNFTLDAKLYLADPSATVSLGHASAEIQFRTDSGVLQPHYSLAFDAGASEVCLRRSDNRSVIQGARVPYSLTAGTVLYATISCVDSHLKIRVGTQPGLADVANWELNDGTFTSQGYFQLVNDGMLDCRWDYFRYRPISVRRPDVKLIVPPNAYTGAIQ